MTEREFRERRSAFADDSPKSAKERAPETPVIDVESEAPSKAPSETAATESGVEGDPLAGMSLPDPSFVEIVQILAVQALQLMGADPFGTGETESRVFPDQARRFIDLLDILQQRTQGNLSPEEANVLEQVLTDLRTQFLRLQS